MRLAKMGVILRASLDGDTVCRWASLRSYVGSCPALEVVCAQISTRCPAGGVPWPARRTVAFIREDHHTNPVRDQRALTVVSSTRQASKRSLPTFTAGDRDRKPIAERHAAVRR